MTVLEMQRELMRALAAAVGDSEARAMAREMLCAAKGYTFADLAVSGDRSLTDESVEKLRAQAGKIVGGMPMQYVLGEAWFHGRSFKVTPAVLIPRPETSQLVDIITADLAGRRDLRILDIGTGSGCIAICLGLDLPFSAVTAIDISVPALEVAAENARRLGAKIDFLQADALEMDRTPALETSYDCIVSNPPYIMESEKPSMDSRVFEFEPATALFVPDSDPLLFYKAISRYAYTHLCGNGCLYFEINPLCADALVGMLAREGFDYVEIIRDYKGTNRFARAMKRG